VSLLSSNKEGEKMLFDRKIKLESYKEKQNEN